MRIQSLPSLAGQYSKDDSSTDEEDETFLRERDQDDIASDYEDLDEDEKQFQVAILKNFMQRSKAANIYELQSETSVMDTHSHVNFRSGEFGSGDFTSTDQPKYSLMRINTANSEQISQAETGPKF